MNEVFTGFVQGILGSSQLTGLQRLGELAARVTLALIISLMTLFIAARVRNTIQLFFRYKKGDPGLAILLGRIGNFSILLLGLLVILPLFGLSATALFATLGVLGLAVSLAMQDVLKNVFAGLYLLVERPFRPGEVVKVREFVGTIENVDLRTTTLRADGELIYVPNAILFAEILINRGIARPPIKEELKQGIDQE